MRKLLGALVVGISLSFLGMPAAMAGDNDNTPPHHRWQHRHHRRHHHCRHHKHQNPNSKPNSAPNSKPNS